MARARNIKPSFFANDDLADLPPLGRLLFIGLWTLADREGRLEDRPRRVKAEVLPYDDCDVDALLDSLHKHGFILRYTVGDDQFIQVVNFSKHQNPHVKESASSIPASDEHHTSTVQEQNNTQPEPERAGLIPDSPSLIPDSGYQGEERPPAAQPDAFHKQPKNKVVSLSVADLTALQVDEQVAKEFLSIRKSKRAALTRLALDGIRREADGVGWTLDQTLRKCVERGWQGFEAAWVTGNKTDIGALRHGNFAKQDYRAGIGADGSF
jgi:hypothetical protein